MLRGNRGEWSELYAFLKLLADTKLYAADEDLNKMENIFYPIIKIIRDEIVGERIYKTEDGCGNLDGNIRIFDSENNEIATVPIRKFMDNSKKLYNMILSKKGRSFTADNEIQDFLKTIDFYSLKSPSSKKTDIVLVIHDYRTNTQPRLGFSIKSMLGQKSTLFNPSGATNFIYRVTNKENNIDSDNIYTELNKINNMSVIKKINWLFDHAFNLEFKEMQNSNFMYNLQLIDSRMPEIISYILLVGYAGNSSDKTFRSLLNVTKKKNPLGFCDTSTHPFYEYKIKNFLTEIALGMTAGKEWNGMMSATGGIIIVKKDGEIVCYHIYNRNEFQEYLLNHTMLDQPSTSRYGYGNFYTENGEILLKLNLQIRFTE
jgi:hypothetical protein